MFGYQTKNISSGASITDADQKKGIITGYFSHFDNVDSDGDIIRPGAFLKTIRENGPKSNQPRIKHLLNHDISQPLGKLIDLKEDTAGLYYESQIGTHTLGTDFVKMVDSGLVSEHSIGYKTIKRNQIQDFEGYMKNPSKGWFELTELKLWEGSSLTGFGANPLTPVVGMKKEEKESYLQLIENRQQALEKFCRNSTASDETIELLLIECKQLSQIIIDLTTKPGLTTLPEDDLSKPDKSTLKEDDVMNVIKKFRQTIKLN